MAYGTCFHMISFSRFRRSHSNPGFESLARVIWQRALSERLSPRTVVRGHKFRMARSTKVEVTQCQDSANLEVKVVPASRIASPRGFHVPLVPKPFLVFVRTMEGEVPPGVPSLFQ